MNDEMDVNLHLKALRIDFVVRFFNRYGLAGVTILISMASDQRTRFICCSSVRCKIFQAKAYLEKYLKE